MALSDLPVFRELAEEKTTYFPSDDVKTISSALGQASTATTQRLRAEQYGKHRFLDFTFLALAGQFAALHWILM